MADFYVVRMFGGPKDGQFFPPKSSCPWPFPDVIETRGGSYVKISQSDLPDSIADAPHVARGVQYKWQPASSVPPTQQDTP